ncbi:uncharacterized protein J4E84_008494 [Alternaria hordeiaustralica]|uniref:uncharacterized protein n=1 Tax=Alternaria hordeiaustralica TaxID=1187925 RepID=UPI0020C208CB|nr:uncharacterized protein J4E84_008494 [Alternaria hordeiaustralica]KAI4678676.1 hypothetical protein J4E84_008494 [Alternaria hordeiaustralica]
MEIAAIPNTQQVDTISKTGLQTSDDPKVIWERQLLKEGSYLIADSLAQNSSKSAAVFRRYDKLAMHRLIVLSRELRGFEKAHDRRVDDLGLGRGLDEPESEIHSEQFGLKVMEYCERDPVFERLKFADNSLDNLMAAYSSVLHLEAPAGRTVEALDRFISSPELHGKTAKPWLGHQLKYRTDKYGDKITFTDLVSLYTPAENDYLSRFVDKFLYPFFLTPGSNKNAKYVNEQKMQKFVTFIGTIISIGFLVSAMWVLWRLEKQMIAKLATVTGFVVAFAGWLGFLTTAQRKDVIAATAAYAAVLVVFVSQQN